MSCTDALAVVLDHQGEEGDRSFLGRLSAPLIQYWLPEASAQVVDRVHETILSMYFAVVSK